MGLTKVNSVAPNQPATAAQFFRNYNRIDIQQQLNNNVLVQDDLNPWYTFDIEKAMMERNIAYRVWRWWRTTADRDRYKDTRRRACQLYGKEGEEDLHEKISRP
jgi:hypothetical protein